MRERKLIFLVLIFFFLCFLVLPFRAQAQGAVLYLSPQIGNFYVGSTFDVSVLLDTKGKTINTVDVNISFSPETLQVVEPLGDKSIITVWASPPSYSNVEGKISFRGGIPQAGVKTSSGLLFTITFRAKAPGKARVIFESNSKVLLHDGKGTNVLGSTIGGMYNIVIPPPQGPKVFSPTHPDQDKWYNKGDVTLMWEKEEGIEGYSYVLTRNPAEIPDNISEGKAMAVNYEGIEDGLWYFHIKAKKGNQWGGVSTFLVRIDTEPPADFSIQTDYLRTTNKRPIISFYTTDTLSGIDHYEVKVIPLNRPNDKTDYPFTEAVSPYQLPSLGEGSYDIIVRVFDRAGNFRDAKIKIEIVSSFLSFLARGGIMIFGIFIPWWFLILILLLIVAGLIFLIYYNKRKHKEMKEKVSGSLSLMREIIDNEASLLAKKLKDGQVNRQEVMNQLEVLEDLRRKIKDEKNY